MKKWLAGIIASVIAGVTIYWLTAGRIETVKAKDPIASLQVSIVAPISNTTVEVYDNIRGRVTNKDARVWVVIQPLHTNDCWVQKPVIVDADGSWLASVQFGENTPAHSGSPYEVRALANPRGHLVPGRTSCWPEAEAISRPLFVRRS